ncbi:hypothetical protein HKX48_007218 [Thoreauomyces humboldtii]|nr:hypothetical protein HKX48_007218 [Thoreauomyces humboldtii]
MEEQSRTTETPPLSLSVPTNASSKLYEQYLSDDCRLADGRTVAAKVSFTSITGESPNAVRGQHEKGVTDMMNALAAGYDSKVPMTLVERDHKPGEPQYGIIDGWHRFEAMRRLHEKDAEAYNDAFFTITAWIMKKSTPQQARLEMGLAQNSVAETTVRSVLADKAIGIINLATSWKEDKGTYPSSNEIGSLMQRVDHRFTAKKSSTWGNYSSFVHWPKETLEYLHHDVKTFPEAVPEDWAPAVGKKSKGVAAKETPYGTDNAFTLSNITGKDIREGFGMGKLAMQKGTTKTEELCSNKFITAPSQVPAFIKKAFVLIAKTKEAAATGGETEPAAGGQPEEPEAAAVSTASGSGTTTASGSGTVTEETAAENTVRRSLRVKKTAEEIAEALVAEIVSEDQKKGKKRTTDEAQVAPAAEEEAADLTADTAEGPLSESCHKMNIMDWREYLEAGAWDTDLPVFDEDGAAADLGQIVAVCADDRGPVDEV